jgi:DAACS family dicarboxylate/amino acid:cation (Na+ or H+) symporter
MALHTRILIGLVAGAAVGVATNRATGGGAAVEGLVKNLTEPLGRMWLSALIMVVLSLLGFLSLTALSTLLGLGAVNLVQPGRGLDPEVTARLLEAYRGEAQGAMGLSSTAFGVDLLVKIVPRNPVQAAAGGDMLAVIFFSLMVGVALARMSAEKSEAMVKLLESLGHVTINIIELVMKLAPLGVFCLIFSVTSRFGYDLLLNLLKYVLTVAGSLALFLFVGYPLILAFVARRRPGEFFKRAQVVMLTAFSTSSSNATLPTTLRVAQESLGLPREIAGFVLPLGATMNMNGTVLFLAQVFGVELSLYAQLVVVLMSVITAIGVAGIPGGSIPLLMMVAGMVGVPMEGVAIVLGVDRILDMCRTVLNVTGDLVTATVVARFEGPRLTA